MRRYVLQRLLSVFPVLVGMVTLVFVLLRALPGEPTAVLAAQAGGSGEDAARLRAEYGLDRPLIVQYARFLFSLATGKLGRSLYTRQRVSQIILQQAPATISLALAALLVAVSSGLFLGIVAAMRQDTWVDVFCMTLSVAGVSVPITLSGLIMVLLFSLTLHWLPATGQGTLRHIVMPATVMGLASAGSIARLVRAQLIEILRQEYMIVARAKGLNEWSLLLRHALRVALVPTITLVGLQFGFMLGGAVATESVFARQGLGRTLVDAILYQDYPVVQGVVIVSAALYTLINLVVDLLHGYLDPRIHYA
jgi:ABC-type dipeptide/oligopeptide/nickel transport system permease component